MADKKNEAPKVDAPEAEAPEETKPKAIDSHEVSVGWTVQQGGKPAEPDDVPGAVITVDELPSRESLAAAGVDLDQYFAGLVVAADEEEKAALRA